MRRAEAQASERIRAARLAIRTTAMPREPDSQERRYIEGVGFLIGDITCEFNARSPYIRCGVNPIGPCKDCPYYKPLAIDSGDKKL